MPLLLRPDWPAPSGVDAAMSLRSGGVSRGAWESLNLGLGVGDDLAAVTENRRRYAAALGARPVWLRLVHGAAVLRLNADAGDIAPAPADAGWTSARGLACTVQAADCMPVLFALRDGSAVGAAHAGWRGLAGGVLEATVRSMCAGMGTAPADLLAWLGPCIGPGRFEVGADVLQAFGVRPDGMPQKHFVIRPRADGALRWLADLPGLARDRLAAAGVAQITVTDACTFDDPSRFFSFRRDGVTGRHAVAIWRR